MSRPGKTRRWAIVGTSWFANDYIAPAINAVSSAKLVAVHSRDKARGTAFAAKHGIARSYDSYHEMLSDPEVEVVHIVTPNHLHARQTIEAAEAGKHVLCEKPMSLTIEDGELMIEACRKNNVKLGVGFQNRHHPAHMQARRLISSGEAGDITLVTVQNNHPWMDFHLSGWRADPAIAGGGSLMGMGAHCIDLLRFFLAQEVEEVSAISDAKWIDKPLEETILINLKFENGPFGSVIAGFHVPRPYNDVVIHGTKARIRGVDTLGMPMKGHLQVTTDSSKTEYSFPESITGKYVHEIETFNRCLEEDTEPSVSGIDGLEMVRLTLSILESAKQQRSIRIKR